MFTMIASQNCQAERNEAANQEKQAADDLEAADDVNVAAGRKSACKYSPVTPCGERWHRKEMQESVGTEDNEDQSEKDPGDNSKNFHSSMMTSSRCKFQ